VFVVAVLVSPFSELVMAMAASDTAAPLVSVTDPLIVPVVES
jgi:hypothetical protein